MKQKSKTASKPSSKPSSKPTRKTSSKAGGAAPRRIREPIKTAEPIIRVRRSKIHGRGVYATRRIRAGTRVIEYVGERMSHDAADDRYADRGPDDGHTFLFIVDDDIVIDAGVGGSAARYINHKCDANCEPMIEGGRIFIDAIRTIQPGEELGYDYSLTWVSTDDPEELKLYVCRCGSPLCRGTMLDPESFDEREKAKNARKAKRSTSAKSPVTSKGATSTDADTAQGGARKKPKGAGAAGRKGRSEHHAHARTAR